MRADHVGTVALLAILGAAAACAASDDNAPPVEPPSVIPDGGGLETDAEAGVDAGDASDAVDAGPCSASGICIVPAPIDTQINVTSVWGSGPNDVWAVGTSRTVLHYNGTIWEKAAPMTDDASPFTMRSVWLGAPNDVWIAAGPFIYHSTGWNGPTGTEWKTAFELDGASNTAIRGTNGTVWIARQVLNNPWTLSPSAIVCREWSGDGPVDGAFVETPMLNADGADGLWSLATTGADEAWATSVGSNDRPGARVVRFHRAGDAGAEWQVEEHDSRTSRNLHGVWGNDQVVWVVGEGGVLRRMTPAKLASHAFEVVASPVTTELRAAWGFGANDVWAVGDDATVLHFDGNAWARLATSLDAASEKPNLFAVWGSAPNDVWIGGNGVMLHFEGHAQ
jgi:hypothetical protein